MTPDLLHYVLVAAGWIAIPAFLVAALVLRARVQSRWSAVLVVGLCAILAGQVVQQLSPVHDQSLEEFKGIVVSTGRLPLVWYLGSLLSAAGWLTSAAGALGVAFAVVPQARGGASRPPGE